MLKLRKSNDCRQNKKNYKKIKESKIKNSSDWRSFLTLRKNYMRQFAEHIPQRKPVKKLSPEQFEQVLQAVQLSLSPQLQPQLSLQFCPQQFEQQFPLKDKNNNRGNNELLNIILSF